ncbi:MAG: hypothetical protein IIB57_10820 [Planctomycetes bacterium]|nr:hypothetical protein [Planctomycetota bacterium]
MLGITAMTVLLAVAQLPEDAVGVSARLDASELTVGEDYEIILDINLKDGWSISTAGIGGAILQIDVPRSIRLSGKVLKSKKELAENEFLAAPYERLLVEFPAHIAFTLKKEPKESDRIALNVLAYASTRGRTRSTSSANDSNWPFLPERRLSRSMRQRAIGVAATVFKSGTRRRSSNCPRPTAARSSSRNSSASRTSSSRPTARIGDRFASRNWFSCRKCTANSSSETRS